jgi:glucokinase
MILAGDIGGTKTLLAAYDGGRCVARQRFDSRAYGGFDALLREFIASCARAGSVEPTWSGACFGIAGPVLDQRVKVTNLPWEIDGARLAASFGIGRVVLLNDFEAAAHGLEALAPGALATLQPGEPDAARPRVLIGAGTGLGVAYLIDARVIAGEGGHAGFAPADDEQARLADWLRSRLGRVEVEHVVSGAGLARIGEFLLDSQPRRDGAALRAVLGADEPARAISRLALERGDPQASAAIDLFIRCYGTVAGDHALALLARGGVYLAGGIAPALLPRLRTGGFVSAFNDKGGFAAITRACPVHVITDPDLGLLGAARHVSAVDTKS